MIAILYASETGRIVSNGRLVQDVFSLDVDLVVKILP